MKTKKLWVKSKTEFLKIVSYRSLQRKIKKVCVNHVIMMLKVDITDFVHSEIWH